jgi:hypothetical protein
MLSSAADAAACLGLNLYYLKFWHSILSLAKLLTFTVSSNVKLDHIEVLKSPHDDELWSQNISVIIEGIGDYNIVISEIDPSLLVCAEELITFKLAK